MFEDRIVSQLRGRGYNLAHHFIEFHSVCAVILRCTAVALSNEKGRRVYLGALRQDSEFILGDFTLAGKLLRHYMKLVKMNYCQSVVQLQGSALPCLISLG